MKKMVFIVCALASHATFSDEIYQITKKDFFNDTMSQVYHLVNDNYYHASRLSDALKTFLNSLELLPYMLEKQTTPQAKAYFSVLRRYCVLCVETYEVKALMGIPIYYDTWKALLNELEVIVDAAGREGLVNTEDEMRRLRVFSFLDYQK